MEEVEEEENDTASTTYYCAQLGNDAVVVTGFGTEEAAQAFLDDLDLSLQSPSVQIDQAEVTPLARKLFKLVRERHGQADADPAAFAGRVLHGSLQRHVPAEASDKEARHALALAFMLNAITLPVGLLKF